MRLEWGQCSRLQTWPTSSKAASRRLVLEPSALVSTVDDFCCFDIIYIYIYIYIYTHIFCFLLCRLFLARSSSNSQCYYLCIPNTLYDRILQMQLNSLVRTTPTTSTTNPMAWGSLASLEEPTASTTSRVARSTWTTLLPTLCVSRSRALLLPAVIRLQPNKVQKGMSFREVTNMCHVGTLFLSLIVTIVVFDSGP